MGLFDRKPDVEKLKENKDVEGLIKALKNRDWGVRGEAVAALGKIGDSRAVEPLIRALKDEEWLVRDRASEALGEIGDARAAQPLIQALKCEKYEDEYVRNTAVAALRKIGEPAVQPLIQALKDKDKDVREGAAKALGRIGDFRAVDPLIEALKDEVRTVRLAAAGALTKMEDARAVEPLTQALNDKSSEVRKKALQALIKVGKPAVGPLAQALGDESMDVRRKAAQGLHKMGWKPSNKSEQIAYLIATDNWGQLAKIAEAAVEPLIQALKDKDEDVRKKAAKALIKVGEPAVEPLTQALAHKDKDVQFQAMSALKKICSPRTVKALEDYRKKALAQLSRTSGQQILISRYKDYWLKLGRLVKAAGLVSKNQNIVRYLNKVMTASCPVCRATYSKEALGYLTVIGDFGGRFTLFASTRKSASAHEKFLLRKVCPQCGCWYMTIYLNIPEAGA